MQYWGFILAFLSFSLVFILNYEKITSIFLSFFSKEDLIFEKIHVTFDIISKEQINVYKVGKFRIKRNNPQIIIGNYSEFGDIVDAKISIDNVLLNRNDYVKEEKINLIKHNLFHKKNK